MYRTGPVTRRLADDANVCRAVLVRKAADPTRQVTALAVSGRPRAVAGRARLTIAAPEGTP